jgi:hypothetical protein
MPTLTNQGFLYAGHILRALTRFYQRPFNKDWDTLLNEILDNNTELKVGKYTAEYKFEGCTYSIWISNRWYAYAHLNAVNGNTLYSCLEFRPKFKTMLRLFELTKQKQSDALNHASDYRLIYSRK